MTPADRAEVQMRMALRAAQVGLWEWDIIEKRVTYSAECMRQLGYPERETTQPSNTSQDQIHPDDLANIRAVVHPCLEGKGETFGIEMRIRHRDGSWRWFLSHGEVVRDEQGRAVRVLGGHLDITDRKRAELELQRANRMLRLVSDSNQTLIRLTDEAELLGEVCRIAVETGGFRLAWVELRNGRTPSGTVVAAQGGGLPAGFPSAAPGDRHDPVILADAGGEPAFAADLAAHPPEQRWRLLHERTGCASIAALPLRVAGVSLGALCIGSAEADGFPAEDVKLLMELAGDLAFGLHVLRVRGERDRATAALEASERKLAEAEGVSHVGYWEWDVDANVVSWSDETYRIFGLEPQSCVIDAARFNAAVHPEDRPRVGAIEEGAAKGDPVPELAYRIVRPDGEIRHVLSRLARYTHEHTDHILFGTLQDVTESKLAEEALHHREQESRALVENSPDLVCRYDGEGRILYANPAFVRMVGSPLETLLGPRSSDRFPDHVSLREYHAAVRRVFSTGEEFTQELLLDFLPHHDALLHHIRLVPERDRDGRIVSVLGIGRDITPLKRVERALRRSERGLRNAQRLAQVGSWEWEMGTDTFHASDEAIRIAGRTPPLEGLQYASLASLYTPASKARLDAAVQRSISTGEPYEIELELVRPDGDVRIVILRAEVTRDAEEHIVGQHGTIQDVTELRRAARSLELFRTLIDRVSDVIEVVDPETGVFMDVNEAACRAHGYSREEYLRLHVRDIEVGYGMETQEKWQAAAQLFRDAKRTLSEGLHRRKDGSTFPVEVNVSWVHLDREYLVSVVRDITARRNAEEALRESEERFRQVTEAIDEVFWLTDVSKQTIIYVSPAYATVWGRPCASLHADPASWIAAIHPEDRERVHRAALNEQAASAYDEEYRVVRPDGTIRWIHDRAFPIKNKEGEVYRIAGVAADVTTRRELEEQIRQSQKMEAVGQLAGGIAHDFNNLLAVIKMQGSMVLADDPEDMSVRDGVQQIMDAAERAANLTRQLLTFSRREHKQARDIDLAEVIGGMTRLLRRLLGEDIVLETRFAPALPMVNADPGMMEQVLMNLAVNARDAMPEGGRLTVALDPIVADLERAAAAGENIPPGSYVQLSVTDTGSGIAPEHIGRIFEPFFTTKEVGKGTGLGLATVFGIVQLHQGWIEAHSKVGRGTVMRVFLPALQRRGAEEYGIAASRQIRGGSETILLVEDETAVRRAAKLSLQRHGYNIIEADSAASALSAWQQHQGPRIDLLLTDLVMPGGVSGAELAQRLRAARPDLKVVYTSGYSNETLDRKLPGGADRHFLPKPYTMAELAATLRNCLDGLPPQ